jgi:hypothetical protein
MSSETAKRAMMKSFEMPDERSFAVMKMLNDVYPAFASKLFQGNELMQKLVMSGYNCMDILDYPICGKCETLAAYDGYGLKDGKHVLRCTCMDEKCGHSTLNPPTLRQWVKWELKKKVDDEWFEALDYAVDAIAMSMVNKHKNEMAQATSVFNGERREKCIIMPDGTECSIEGNGSLVEHYSQSNEELENEFTQLLEQQED